MSEDFTPVNELEKVLLTHGSTPAGIGVFLPRLMMSTMVVLVREASDGGVYPMRITGINGTPMVAMFTSTDRATVWVERSEDYRTAIVVDARWALLQIDEGCGVAINPGNPVGFEIAAEGLQKVLRDFGVTKDDH